MRSVAKEHADPAVAIPLAIALHAVTRLEPPRGGEGTTGVARLPVMMTVLTAAADVAPAMAEQEARRVDAAGAEIAAVQTANAVAVVTIVNVVATGAVPAVAPAPAWSPKAADVRVAGPAIANGAAATARPAAAMVAQPAAKVHVHRHDGLDAAPAKTQAVLPVDAATVGQVAAALEIAHVLVAKPRRDPASAVVIARSVPATKPHATSRHPSGPPAAAAATASTASSIVTTTAHNA